MAAMFAVPPETRGGEEGQDQTGNLDRAKRHPRRVGRLRLERLSAVEQAAFAGNAIALGDQTVWISAAADRALAPATRAALYANGFSVRSVTLDAIETAGGSLRCCVAEIFQAGPPT